MRVLAVCHTVIPDGEAHAGLAGRHLSSVARAAWSHDTAGKPRPCLCWRHASQSSGTLACTGLSQGRLCDKAGRAAGQAWGRLGAWHAAWPTSSWLQECWLSALLRYLSPSFTPASGRTVASDGTPCRVRPHAVQALRTLTRLSMRQSRQMSLPWWLRPRCLGSSSTNAQPQQCWCGRPRPARCPHRASRHRPPPMYTWFASKRLDRAVQQLLYTGVQAPAHSLAPRAAWRAFLV